jgi:hypothetical protein
MPTTRVASSERRAFARRLRQRFHTAKLWSLPGSIKGATESGLVDGVAALHSKKSTVFPALSAAQ